jgi:predicted AlkP superfamily pyrophosphatase or phosphodiesterase
MINPESLAAVDAARFGPSFMRPLYDSYGFAQIPQTVRACFTGDTRRGVPFGPREDLYGQYDAVVLLFIDAFGWRFFEQYRERSPFLKRFVDEGLVCKLTTQFPSTTAAHVTTIHTGLPVCQSGVYEWFYYEPSLDTLIAPLLFSYAGDRTRDTLTEAGADPSTLYPTRTIYQDLRQHGVESFIFYHQGYARSAYSNVVTNGAQTISYRTFAEALISLGQLLDRQQRPTYCFIYLDSIDGICHHHGPESPHTAAEIEVFLATMETVFQPTIARSRRRTLVLLTADHGQTAIDPGTTIYLNRSVPQLRRYLKTNRAGDPLVPAGSSRDMFLYVEDAYLEEAANLLRRALDGRAEIHEVRELIAQGFFGPGQPSPAFLSRVGNLVILPYLNESVWWYEQRKFEQIFYGAHGGLTRNEMETLLLAQAYGQG